MKFRRYYLKGVKYERTLSPEYFDELVSLYGVEYAIEQDTAEYELFFEDREEYDDYLQDSYLKVMNNIRWYLDNLDKVPVFETKLCSQNQKLYKVNM